MSVTSTMSYNFADPSLVAPPSPSESNVSMEPLFTEQVSIPFLNSGVRLWMLRKSLASGSRRLFGLIFSASLPRKTNF